MDIANLLPSLIVAGIVGLASSMLMQLRRPAVNQEKLMWMAMAAAGAYALRQFEGRGAQSESFAVSLASMDAKNEERFRTVFSQLHDLQGKLDTLTPPRKGRGR